MYTWPILVGYPTKTKRLLILETTLNVAYVNNHLRPDSTKRVGY